MASPPPSFPAYPSAPFLTEGSGLALGIILGTDLALALLLFWYFARPVGTRKAEPLGAAGAYARAPRAAYQAPI